MFIASQGFTNVIASIEEARGESYGIYDCYILRVQYWQPVRLLWAGTHTRAGTYVVRGGGVLIVERSKVLTGSPCV